MCVFRPVGYSSVERKHLHVRCIDFVVSQCFWFLAVDATVLCQVVMILKSSVFCTSLSLCFVCIFSRLFRVNNLCSCLSLVFLSSVHLVELLCSDILFAVVCCRVLRCNCFCRYFVRYFVCTLLSRLAYLEIKIYI